MPNTLREKALKQPFRVGLMLGALTIPAGWVLSETVLRVATRYPLLNAAEVTSYFASGALPGMVLGAGLVRAWAAWQTNQKGHARWLLMVHGGLVALVTGALAARDLWNSSILQGKVWLLGHPVPAWMGVPFEPFLAKNFPLQCALAMLLFGLFLRAPRR